MSQRLELSISARVMTILFVIAFVVSCDHNRVGLSKQLQGDSVSWADSAYQLNVIANELFNEGKVDSLEAFVSVAMQTCLEHHQMERYYIIWRVLIEKYIWTDEYDKAMLMAKDMESDAIMRHENHGLFEAYSLLGLGYAYRGNVAESVKFFRKAINIFQSKNPAPLMEAYNYLTQVLTDFSMLPELGQTLAEWKVQIDRNHYSTSAVTLQRWTQWNFEYQRMLSEYLSATQQYEAASAAIDSAEYYLKIKGEPRLDRINLLYTRISLDLRQHNYEDALKLCDVMLEWAISNTDNSHKINAINQKVKALQGLERYKEALHWLQTVNAFKDSVTTADNIEQLNMLNKRFEVNELKMEAKEEQLFLVMLISVVAIIALIIFIIYRHWSTVRLKKVHSDLKTAYDQLEEATTAKERMESELRIARDIQMSMVPSMFPSIEGLDMYASMTPAREVGGDLYNYMQKGDQLYFCVGDVSGKGVPASLFMALATHGFLNLASIGSKPSEIANWMNKDLTRNNEMGMFVTMFICRYDLKLGRLEYCNAGHNPPVIYSADGQFSFLNAKETNAPIGLWRDLEYVGEEIEVFSDRLILLYTDGLNEAENVQQEQYGEERIIQLITSHASQDAPGLIEALKADVDRFRDGAKQNDDLTMLAFRFTLPDSSRP